jgi:hypothetical protein
VTLTIALTGFLCICCFVIGAKVGQKVSKGEPIELPNINPIEKIREQIEKKEAKREQDRYEAIMQNVENYNGTGEGQRDIPNV